MRAGLQLEAQRSFVNSGTSIPLLIDLDQANAGITADRQASVARGVASVELDDFDAVMKMHEQRSELERQQEATTQARERFEDLQAAAEAEVVALAEIERQRLADVAVQRELERQRQVKLAQEAARPQPHSRRRSLRAATARAERAVHLPQAAPAPSGRSSSGGLGSRLSGPSWCSPSWPPTTRPRLP